VAILVDTNVIVDILTDDPNWADWSERTLDDHSEEDLSINPVIYAELCFGCDSVAEVDDIVRQIGLSYMDTPRDGLFRAAKAFARYKKAGGTKDFVLPDFFIGGHAEASSLSIITRDVARYATYFQSVALIHP
jgi:predicted nucleic acid-binding protein